MTPTLRLVIPCFTKEWHPLCASFSLFYPKNDTHSAPHCPYFSQRMTPTLRLIVPNLREVYPGCVRRYNHQGIPRGVYIGCIPPTMVYPRVCTGCIPPSICLPGMYRVYTSLYMPPVHPWVYHAVLPSYCTCCPWWVQVYGSAEKEPWAHTWE